MNAIQILLQFILSGSVVVGATIIANSIDSKWSGLLVALPIMTILGLIFISTNNSTIVTERYLLSALLFMIPAAIYLLSTYLLMGKLSLIMSCLISIIPFGISIFLIEKLI